MSVVGLAKSRLGYRARRRTEAGTRNSRALSRLEQWRRHCGRLHAAEFPLSVFEMVVVDSCRSGYSESFSSCSLELVDRFPEVVAEVRLDVVSTKHGGACGSAIALLVLGALCQEHVAPRCRIRLGDGLVGNHEAVLGGVASGFAALVAVRLGLLAFLAW